MPLVILIAIVAFVVMYYRFHTSGLSRNCRWREDRERGECHCVHCGARVACEARKLPDICLRGQVD